MPWKIIGTLVKIVYYGILLWLLWWISHTLGIIKQTVIHVDSLMANSIAPASPTTPLHIDTPTAHANIDFYQAHMPASFARAYVINNALVTGLMSPARTMFKDGTTPVTPRAIRIYNGFISNPSVAGGQTHCYIYMPVDNNFDPINNFNTYSYVTDGGLCPYVCDLSSPLTGIAPQQFSYDQAMSAIANYPGTNTYQNTTRSFILNTSTLNDVMTQTGCAYVRVWYSLTPAGDLGIIYEGCTATGGNLMNPAHLWLQNNTALR